MNKNIIIFTCNNQIYYFIDIFRTIKLYFRRFILKDKFIVVQKNVEDIFKNLEMY